MQGNGKDFSLGGIADGIDKISGFSRMFCAQGFICR
jgi:hypothetical protein